MRSIRHGALDHPWLGETSGEASNGPATDFYLRPIPALEGDLAAELSDAGQALPLAGDRSLGFQAVEVIRRGPAEITSRLAYVSDLPDAWAARIDALSRPRPVLPGLHAGCPSVMGVVNVTPDSFSDGGRHADPARAIEHGRVLARAGADILDVGGESTRPGAAPVDVGEEIARVVPVIEGLVPLGRPVSIDTRKPDVMRAAVAAGAAIVNDVTALTHDPESAAAVAELGVPAILMHMAGTPETMQDDPRYDHPLLDVFDFLAERMEAAVAAGVARDRLLVDPGIGFGKNDAHNLAILGRLELLHGLGAPIVLGVSRKSLIGRLSAGEAAADRGPGSLALALDAVRRGVQVLRVHDVAETRQAVRLALAVRLGTRVPPSEGSRDVGA
jgi:dihydropteroate synthase